MPKRTRLALIVLASLFLMGQSSVPGVLVLDGSTVKGRATTLVCGDNLACSFAGGTVTMDASGSGTGAPADATYITQTASAGLSAEQALSSLGTALLKNTTGTGVLSAYAGSTCVGAASGVRAYGISAAGAALCDYTNVSTVIGILPVANGGTGSNAGNPWLISGASADTSTSSYPNGTAITGISITLLDSSPATMVRCHFNTLSASSSIGVQIAPVITGGSPTNFSWTRRSCATLTSTAFWADSGPTALGAWDTGALASPIKACMEEITASAVGAGGGAVLTFHVRPETGGTTVTVKEQSFCEYRGMF